MICLFFLAGEKNHLPKDEDIEEFAPTRFQMPPGDKKTIISRSANSRNPPYFQNPYNTFRVRSPIYPTLS